MATITNKLATNKRPNFSTAITLDSYKNLINRSIQEPKEAQKFIADMMSVVSTNPVLSNCEAGSIISCGLTARSLNLPLSGGLGYVYAVPYGDKATFICGYKGLLQLAMRSGQYRRIGVRSVHQGEYKGQDEFGDDEFRFSHEFDDKPVVGYYAYFETLNGFKKTVYWTVDMCQRHAKKYSKSYGTGKTTDLWTNSFDMMAQKTVLKQLLSRYGIFSIDIQNAIKYDQAAINVETNTVEYVDSVDNVDDTQELNNVKTTDKKAGNEEKAPQENKDSGFEIPSENDDYLKDDEENVQEELQF